MKKVKAIQFEEKEIDVKETYVDDGVIRERVKKVKVPDFEKPPKIIYEDEEQTGGME